MASMFPDARHALYMTVDVVTQREIYTCWIILRGSLCIVCIVLCSYPCRLSDSWMQGGASVGLFGDGEQPTRIAAFRRNQSTRLGLSVNWPIKKPAICSAWCVQLPSQFPRGCFNPKPGYGRPARSSESISRKRKAETADAECSTRAANWECSRVEQLLFPGVCPYCPRCRLLAAVWSVATDQRLFLSRTLTLRPAGIIIGYGFEL